MIRTYLDVHILQTVPPSNINRDDTGSPKTAVFGGTRRARVSSQAWKRATRAAFADLIDPAQLGVRTKRVVELIASVIAEQKPELADRSEELAEGVLSAAGIKTSKPKKEKAGQELAAESAYLLFLSRHQIRRLAELAIAADASSTAISKADARAAADSGHSIDLALFGRMVADAPHLSVDATAQVAHAISVHPVDNEFDYFTAIDDGAPDDNAGAGMIGTVEFNSSTLYRYATVNVEGLRSALGDDQATVTAVTAFLRAFATSMPTGKQNTFANRTLPDAILVTIRSDQPVNFVGAFEGAVTDTASAGRLREASVRLSNYAAEIARVYGAGVTTSLVVRLGTTTEPLSAIAEDVTFDELLSRVTAKVSEGFGKTA